MEGGWVSEFGCAMIIRCLVSSLTICVTLMAAVPALAQPEEQLLLDLQAGIAAARFTPAAAPLRRSQLDALGVAASELQDVLRNARAQGMVAAPEQVVQLLQAYTALVPRNGLITASPETLRLAAEDLQFLARAQQAAPELGLTSATRFLVRVRVVTLRAGVTVNGLRVAATPRWRVGLEPLHLFPQPTSPSSYVISPGRWRFIVYDHGTPLQDYVADISLQPNDAELEIRIDVP
jgi:hypothetical protein